MWGTQVACGVVHISRSSIETTLHVNITICHSPPWRQLHACFYPSPESYDAVIGTLTSGRHRRLSHDMQIYLSAFKGHVKQLQSPSPSLVPENDNVVPSSAAKLRILSMHFGLCRATTPATFADRQKSQILESLACHRLV
jgi:hypothetical protein